MEKREFKSKLLLITYGVILFVLLMNYDWVFNAISIMWKVLLPFIIGVVIAFILNVLIHMLEDGVLKKFDHPARRPISIVSSLVIVFGLIVVLLFILIPQVQNAGMIFMENIPRYHETLYDLGEKIGLTEAQLEFLDLDDNKIMNEITTLITENSNLLLDYSFGVVNSVIGAVTNFFVGLVFAIYVLLDKENLARQFKKLFSKLFPKKVYERIIDIFHLSNTTFSNFVKVQVLEACILGLLCFLGMLIIGLPYAATIAVLIGFTALIPIFGAFIGCVIGAFLIFMINPIQAIIFIIFFLVLQQIEGNFIYPKVVGGKIGLPSIWVLVAVMIGGSIGGVFGMLLGVPVCSIIYTLLKKYVNVSRTKRN